MSISDDDNWAKITPDRKPDPELPKYVPPTVQEVAAAIADTPLAVYVREASVLGENIAWEYLLVDAIVYGGLLLGKMLVRNGLGLHDYEPILPNIYAMKLGCTGWGKGRSSKLVVNGLMPSRDIGRLRGNSSAAIVGYAKDHSCQFGLYYVDEVGDILDPNNICARQIVNTLLSGFDKGEMDFVTRKGGHENTIVVRPAAPSVIIDAQPSIIEGYAGRTLLSSGYLARHLFAFPSAGIEAGSEIGLPNISAIEAAYAPLEACEKGKLIIRGAIKGLRSRGNAFIPSMSAAEDGIWRRLLGQYVHKISMIVDPRCLVTGQVSQDAMQRALVLCDHFLGQAIRGLKLFHDNVGAARRARAVEYILENPRCTDRDLYRFLHCSHFEFSRDIAPTIKAAGLAHTRTIEGKSATNIRNIWLPGPDKVMDAEITLPEVGKLLMNTQSASIVSFLPPPAPVSVAAPLKGDGQPEKKMDEDFDGFETVKKRIG